MTFTTTDNFDFYGGGRRRPAIVLTGADPRGGGNRDPNPDGTGSYLNWAAFARPSGRLDLGNAPQRFFRLPWIRNTDLPMFKNFQMGGGRRMQFRWEVYNLFNTVNWCGIDTSAQFNPAGRAGRHPVRQGDERARPAHHAGRAPLQLLDRTTAHRPGGARRRPVDVSRNIL